MFCRLAHIKINEKAANISLEEIDKTPPASDLLCIDGQSAEQMKELITEDMARRRYFRRCGGSNCGRIAGWLR